MESISTHFRREKIENYILRLRGRKESLENQLVESYTSDSLKLITEGEIKQINQIIDEIEREFKLK